MSDWGGFSDAELRHLRSGGDSTATKAKPASSKSPKKALAAKKTSKPKPPKKLPDEALLPTSTNAEPAKQEPKEEIQVNKVDTSSNQPEVPDFIEEEVAEQKKKMEIQEVEKIQKEMEEKNKRRRAALAQEVISRQKKAALESKMLATIQDELVKLDNLLNADVAVIRDQIDKACVEFSEANRRFQTAEKEYVDAKFDLQQKLRQRTT
ncbi:Oidioi.mRNA.OKI2018_I69.PAR.g12620.t1.cds [Oikopleura dioica]|uniref:RAB6-interacting golgin n=1 Tax=Oikopleura dioica TaxID=34765 RepID=A0ABN7S0R6_OIKDI|nr:Oidioi.mRNA.OKI2018_I69.PAR.g12620.t1.cds [Oikopleura dioica]